MFAFLLLRAFTDVPQPQPITEGLAIAGVAGGGRRPILDDAIVDKIVDGTWEVPHDGGTVTFHGHERTWKPIKAGKNDTFTGPALENGYVSTQVEAPADETVMLNARGDTLVYVNGVPRAGDPYSTGGLNLPIRLHKGSNELLFSTGRGQLQASISPLTKSICLQSDDATLPDILTSDSNPLWGSVIVINGDATPKHNLTIQATLLDGSSQSMKAPEIPAMSDRKEPFLIPIPRSMQTGDTPLLVQVFDGSELLDTTKVTVTVRKPSETHKRTFVSDIDGSVQYYAVNPAQKPSPSNALVLTLHGAGVEAIGQARAYGQKDWVTLVAPTNRRPYGFDWEDIGREDALEVLNIAENTIPHDPMRVDVVGHSMGGHGTWALGTLYPNLFASMAPSAGWLSFWSYAGGWSPSSKDETEQLLRQSMDVSDTLGRVRNTLAEDVYILHGAADDNVPLEEARTGRAALEKIDHPDIGYHEQPGAGHWWGNQCVDWPPIFDMISKAKLDPNASKVDFTTQNPGVSSQLDWVKVDEQIVPLAVSHVVAECSPSGHSVNVTADNVALLTLSALKPDAKVTINGQAVHTDGQSTESFAISKTTATQTRLPGANRKSANRTGPFKQVFARRFVLVVGTAGTAEENKWAADKARYDAETMLYRGNGAVDVILDKDYSAGRYRGRNAILYGNGDTNRAWKTLLARCPIQLSQGKAACKGKQSFDAEDISALVVYPNPYDPNTLVAGIGGTGLVGMKRTDRLPIFSSGVAYPDWILLKKGDVGSILADGFFDNQWKIGAEAAGLNNSK